MEFRRSSQLPAWLLAAVVFAGSNLSVVSTCIGSPKDTVAALPFKLSESGFIHVPVTINGRGPFNFVLDTGSNRSAISALMQAKGF
jgi:hypothetical protein